MKSSHLGVAAIVLALGGLWLAGGGSHPPAQAGEQLRVAAPVAHDNLAVYFVHGPDSLDDSRVVGLQEAIENKWVVVHETGTVSELAIENVSADRDIFIQSGDMIKGGKQDRMIASDMLVRPKSGKLPLPSHCVEQSRWKARGAEAVTHFHKSDSFAVGNDIKFANINRDQSMVWNEVSNNQRKLAANTGANVADPQSPSSLQLTLENPAVRAKVSEYEAQLKAAGENRAGVVGAVFVVNGKVRAAEVYGSSGLFQKAWPKLLRSASQEALADKKPGDAAPAPSAREVELFLASAAIAEPDRPARGEAVPVQGFSGRSGATASLLNTAGGGRAVNWTMRNNDGISAADIAALQRASTAVDEAPVQGWAANINPVLVNPSGNRQLSPQPATVQPSNPSANPVATNRVDNRGSVMLESRDVTNPGAVLHRSYLKK